MQYTTKKDEEKTKDQLIREVADLRHLVTKLQSSKTERKKTAKALRESEERFRKLSEASFEGIAIHENGKILDANQTLADMLGYEHFEIIGMNETDLVAEEYRDLVLKNIISEYEKPYEAECIRKDGTTFTCRFRGKAVPYKGRKVGVSALRNITEQKLAEEALRESRRFFQDILDSIQDGVSVLDINLNIIQMNATMEKWYSHEVPFLGKKCYEVYHGRTKPCEVCPTLRTLNSGKKDFEVVPYKGPEGETGWLELFTFPLINSKTGTKIGVIEYVRNITDRKRAEEALKESETKYRNLFVHMLDGFAYHKIIVNENNQPLDYVFLEVNNAFESLTGLKRDDVIGKKVTEVIPGIRESSFDWINEYGMVALTGKEFRTEQFSEALGKWYSISAYSPKKGYFVAMFIDITERKDAERKLKLFAEELKRSNLELEQFASIASHDLQDPLVSIACSLKLLKKHSAGMLESDSDDFITKAIEKINQMQTLIRNLLAYSRIGTSKKKLKPTDCVAIFEKILANLEAAIQKHGAVVSRDYLPEVRGDATQLVQLFQNLISNAIKFRGNEPPRIHISAKQKGNKWVFSVCDNGIGIEPKNIDDIFKIYHRLHGKTEYPGSGIGLSICKKIVEYHGGRIWVESEPGKGASFYFTLLDSENNCEYR